MAKFMVVPKSLDLERYQDADAFLLPIKDLAVNFDVYYHLEEIKEVVEKYPQKEFFISLNKNMHMSDLELLEKTLIELDRLAIKGIFYYDISVVHLKQNLSLSVDLVWNQEHFTTNAMTSTFWHQHGVGYTCLSNEITKREIVEITKSYPGKIILPVFGYIPMFTSARHVVTNYLTAFHLSQTGKHYQLEHEGKWYPITDSSDVTTVYTSFILDSIMDIPELSLEPIAYFLFYSNMIEEDKMLKILSIYREVTMENREEKKRELMRLCSNTGSGFLHQETIYKVK